VTLLTSQDPDRLPPGFAQPFALHATLAAMLDMALGAGAAGVVCSAADLPGIRIHHAATFLAVTPGIRPAGVHADDQRRVTTVTEAVRLGAGILVLGRAITAAPDPAAALRAARAQAAEAAAATA
jgi:orotidine-5'-phosphate decarboxylase